MQILAARPVGAAFREHGARLGREPINLPSGRIVRVRYAPVATKFSGAAE